MNDLINTERQVEKCEKNNQPLVFVDNKNVEKENFHQFDQFTDPRQWAARAQSIPSTDIGFNLIKTSVRLANHSTGRGNGSQFTPSPSTFLSFHSPVYVCFVSVISPFIIILLVFLPVLPDDLVSFILRYILLSSVHCLHFDPLALSNIICSSTKYHRPLSSFGFFALTGCIFVTQTIRADALMMLK